MGSFRQAGLSLLEIILVLAIAAILMGLAAPAFNHMQAQNNRFSSGQQLLTLLNYTRSLAVTRREIITVCLSDDGISCGSTANGVFVIFADGNENREVDAGELLYQEATGNSDTQYRLRVSAGRNYIRYRPDGTSIEFGSVIICPPDNDARYASRLAVNRSGRPRWARDLNDDGIVNDSDGSSISCPP